MDLQPEVVGIYYLPTIAYKVSTEKNSNLRHDLLTDTKQQSHQSYPAGLDSPAFPKVLVLSIHGRSSTICWQQD